MIVATGTFAALGTVAAIWENPFFIRMTPAGNAEIWILGLLAILIGVFVAIRRPACSGKTAGVGGVLGFLGIACPVCNKILLVIFGGDLLLTYFEPIRIYVAVIGVAIAGWAVVREIRGKDVVCRELQDTSLTPTAGS
ncbi:MAG: hypothetical protein IIC55_07060 [Proteobacteria bacterium]|nr:hypothetical protein [Pseudomonadota bacterium]